MLKHFLDIGKSRTEIAKLLGRNKSSIARELKRNSLLGDYMPCEAQSFYEKRRDRCRPKKKLSESGLLNQIRNLFLNHQWSPEQISERLRLENSKEIISYNTIYRGIYAGLLDSSKLSHGSRGVIRKLRHRGKSRHTKTYEERRGKIQISNEITKRPEIANTRERLGDWEADTVAGKKGKACLVTLTDRKSRYLLCKKITKKTASLVKEAMIELLKGQPLESITPDRGKEFSKHVEISNELNLVEFYFPFPHHPWQRGTNENTNGLLREYFPKAQDIIQSDDYVEDVMKKLNCRPKKCLGWKTPFEVYHSVVLHLT